MLLEQNDKNVSRLALLDLGSQTFRMVVAECRGAEIRIVMTIRENCRLGENLSSTGRIGRGAFERSQAVLKRFLGYLRRFPDVKVRAVATAALRNAENADDFIKTAYEAGVEIEVISSGFEAELAAKGIALAVNSGDSEILLTIDVGGGSTEIMLCQGGNLIKAESFEFGAISVTEEIMVSESRNKQDIAAVKKYVKEMIGSSYSLLEMFGSKPNRMVASGGTATTAGAMHLGLEKYRPEAVRGLVLHEKTLYETAKRLVSMTSEEKRMIKGLEAGRSDVIEAGIIIIHTVMNLAGFDIIEISDGGLLSGLLSTEFEKETNCHAESSRAGSLYF